MGNNLIYLPDYTPIGPWPSWLSNIRMVDRSDGWQP